MTAQLCTSRIFALEWGYLYLTQSLSVISENIAINHILPKTRFFGLHFYYRQNESNFNHCNVIGPKTAEFDEIRQINGHYVIQGHPMRLPICE